MNEITKGQVGALAFNVALEKTQSGRAPMSKAEFDGLCEMVLLEIERAVERVLSGTVGASEKPTKAPRKPRNEAKGTGSVKVSPEEMREFLGKREAATSLTVIASLLGCSKGVAERAIDALGDAVKREKAESNGKGKPPMLYSLAR